MMAPRPSRSRSRPRFWIADDVEACLPPCPPRPPAHLQILVAERSVPIDDEPPKPSRKNRSRDIRHSKLLAETGYYTGFLEKQPPSSSSSASLAAFVPRWPPRWYGSFGSYDGYDHRDGCRRAHARHRRAAYRQILVVCTLFLTAAYAAFRLSCVVHAASGPYSPLHPASSPAAYSELDVWIEEEAHTALRAVLANIGPAAGAADGIVVASPSTGGPNEPNYYYTWTRDAALTVSSLLPMLLPEAYLRPWEVTWDDSNSNSHSNSHSRQHNHTDLLLEGLVRSYASAQARMQVSPNPSGDLWSGGLSEPKFSVDGKPFSGPWGRPQRDGPALRALALIPYAHWLLDRGFPADAAYVAEHLYSTGAMRTQGSVVKNDLEEVAHGWREPSFDLWEEARGSHLWTDAVARRALQAGAGLAARLGDAQAARYYAAQAREVALRTATFAHGAVWNASIPTPEGRNGLDAGALLAFIHAGGRNNTTAGTATSDNLPVSELAATDGATLSTLHAYVLSFDSLYAVNRGRAWVDGWLVGRYSSDIYDGVGFSGGNPWYIATYSVAHVLYAAQAGFARAAAIDFSTAAAFWADLGFAAGAAGAAGVASVAGAADHLGSGAETFRAALRRLGEVADVFVAAAARTIREGTGAMSEQIDRNDGAQRGARDLTWSYAAFLEMKRARDAAKAAVGAVVAVAGLSDKAAE